jgi:predicted nucleic acid-binding protein
LKFDLDATLRWLRPRKKEKPLSRRPDDKLRWVHEAQPVGSQLLLDTTVYVDTLQGSTPTALDALIRLRVCNHSSVCLAELTHSFGRLSPADPRTEQVLKVLGQAIRDIPAHRLVAPDEPTWGAAGVLAGLLFRLGSHAPGAELRCLNDALIYLQARKLGCPVLTGNITDFDFLNQLVPDGQILLYRKVAN